MAETTTTQTGYVNGSHLLLKLGGKCVGHCTSVTVNYNSETKERAVKPVATAAATAGLWKDKSVSGLGIKVDFEGLRFYEETENGPVQIASQWGKGTAVDVVYHERGKDTSPELKGKFVITTLTETSPAQDDTTYSGSLENAGEPDVYPGKA